SGGPTTSIATSSSPWVCSPRAWTRTCRGSRCRTGDACQTEPARCFPSSTREDMAKFVSAQFRRGPRRGAQIVSTGSLREMHRVRSVEENWTSGTGLGFDISRIKDRTYVGHGGGYPGNTTQTLIQLDDKVGVIVLTNTNDSNPSDIARQLMTTVGQAVAK